MYRVIHLVHNGLKFIFQSLSPDHYAFLTANKKLLNNFSFVDQKHLFFKLRFMLGCWITKLLYHFLSDQTASTGKEFFNGCHIKTLTNQVSVTSKKVELINGFSVEKLNRDQKTWCTTTCHAIPLPKVDRVGNQWKITC